MYGHGSCIGDYGGARPSIKAQPVVPRYVLEVYYGEGGYHGKAGWYVEDEVKTTSRRKAVVCFKQTNPWMGETDIPWRVRLA